MFLLWPTREAPVRVSNFSREAMARRIDWERSNQDRKPSISIKDEEEWRASDFASKWIEAREASHARWQKYIDERKARIKAEELKAEKRKLQDQQSKSARRKKKAEQRKNRKQPREQRR
jgi:hypothetical protein